MRVRKRAKEQQNLKRGPAGPLGPTGRFFYGRSLEAFFLGPLWRSRTFRRFFFLLFFTFKNFVFCFFRKNRISLVHIFWVSYSTGPLPIFFFFFPFSFFSSFFSFFFCSDDIVMSLDPFGSRGLATLITKRLVRVEYECAKCPRVGRRRSKMCLRIMLR